MTHDQTLTPTELLDRAMMGVLKAGVPFQAEEEDQVSRPMDHLLINAYKTAKYVVELNDVGEKEIRVGKHYQYLDELMADREAKYAAFITPENPRSQKLSKEENVVRHGKFTHLSDVKKLPYLTGYGCDDEELWGREQSYLTFVKRKEQASELASKFEQNGYLLIEEGARVKLMIWNGSSYVEA